MPPQTRGKTRNSPAEDDVEIKNEVKVEDDIQNEIPLHERIGQSLPFRIGRGAPVGTIGKKKAENELSQSVSAISARKRRHEADADDAEYLKAQDADRAARQYLRNQVKSLKADGRTPRFPHIYYEKDEEKKEALIALEEEKLMEKRLQTGKSVEALLKKRAESNIHRTGAFFAALSEGASSSAGDVLGAARAQEPQTSKFGDTRKTWVKSESNMDLAMDEVGNRVLWDFAGSAPLERLENAHKAANAANPRELAEAELKEMVDSDSCFRKTIFQDRGEKPLRTHLDFSEFQPDDVGEEIDETEQGITGYQRPVGDSDEDEAMIEGVEDGDGGSSAADSDEDEAGVQMILEELRHRVRTGEYNGEELHLDLEDSDDGEAGAEKYNEDWIDQDD